MSALPLLLQTSAKSAQDQGMFTIKTEGYRSVVSHFGTEAVPPKSRDKKTTVRPPLSPRRKMKCAGWLQTGLQPPIGLIKESTRPSCMSGVANFAGSGGVLYPVFLGWWSVYFEYFKVDYKSANCASGECGFYPPPSGA